MSTFQGSRLPAPRARIPVRRPASAPPIVRAQASARERAASLFKARVPDLDGCDSAALESAIQLIEPHLPGEAPTDLHARVRRVLESPVVDRATRMHLLERLSPGARKQILAELADHRRDDILRAEAKRGRSPVVEVDWSAVDLGTRDYCPHLAWAFSILAGGVYDFEEKDPFKGLTPLCEAGFELHRVGHSWDPSPAVVAVRGGIALVVFRGTFSPTGVNVDLDKEPTPDFGGQVHRGFARTARSMIPPVNEILREVSAQQGKPLDVFFTGHSLGAVIAALSAMGLSAEPHVHVAGVYGYGCPRFLDVEARAKLEASPLASRIYQIVNHGDGVPMLPEGDRFVPAGRQMYLDHACGMNHDLTHEEVSDRAAAAPVRGGIVKKLFGYHSMHLYSNKLFLNKDQRSGG